MNERFIRIAHAVIFTCTFIVGVITLGISVSGVCVTRGVEWWIGRSELIAARPDLHPTQCRSVDHP